MQVTLEQLRARKEPINCVGIKAYRDNEEWIVALEEYYDYEMEFNMSDSELLEIINQNQGKRYKHCIAWRTVAGCGYACFEMCDEWQRNKCQEQQDKDQRDLTA